MNSMKFLPIIIYLIALANAAPTTDSPAGQESTVTTTPTPTTTSPADSSSTQSSAQTGDAPSTANPSAPTQPQADSNSSAGHENEPVAHEQLTKTSSFTCYGRSIGYYADIERDCKVYHFCLLGDYNGDAVYQRITYLCLKDSVFDQQVLDCVDATKMSISCKDSEAHYVASNASLRQEIVGHKLHGNETTPGAPSTTTTTAQSA